MDQLTQQHCEACHKGAPTVTEQELAELLPQVPQWSIVERGELKPLERSYKFANFVDALSFTQNVGELAEAQGHHPALLTEWGRVTVTWWTKKIRGLHRNDFVMAAKTDELYEAAFQQA